MVEDKAQLPDTEIGLRQVVSSEQLNEDVFQNSIRPQSLAEYIGQDRVREKLSIAISASKRRGDTLDHLLFHGPPGLGKTTLAAIMARELGVSFKATSGPVLERPSDLAAILSSLETGDVLFIDEIHRLGRAVEEILYPAMEDFSIDIIVGQGPSARSVKLELRPFTLVGATTRVGSLSSPLRDRFGIVERIDFYSPSDLEKIITRAAKVLNVELDGEGAEEISSRARGTPRIANRLLRRARDFAQERAQGLIDSKVAKDALALLEIDERGCDKMDRVLVLAIIDSFKGGPVGVETLAAAISETRETIEDVYEPFLLQQGLIQRTPRGRVATEAAYSHFGRPLPAKNEDRQQMSFLTSADET